MSVNDSTRRRPDSGADAASVQADDFASKTAAAEPGAGSVGFEAGDVSPGAPETRSAAAQVEQLKRERDDFRDQLLRVRADFANYQKRSKQQADAERSYAVGPLARDLLDSIDNLERAVDALRASGASGVTAGLDMVQKQLIDILAKHGVKPIPALGHPFDPNLHDAVTQQPSLDHPAGTVIAELSKGYMIADRVLRPSKVAVSTRPARAD
jgi:molecular chaperone GrpE